MQVTSTLRPDIKSQKLSEHRFRLDFDLLLGLPLEKLLASHGSLDEKLREAGSATTTSCSENPLGKPLPMQNPLETIIIHLHSYHPSPFS